MVHERNLTADNGTLDILDAFLQFGTKQEWAKARMTQIQVAKTHIFCDSDGLESRVSKTWALTLGSGVLP